MLCAHSSVLLLKCLNWVNELGSIVALMYRSMNAVRFWKLVIPGHRLVALTDTVTSPELGLIGYPLCELCGLKNLGSPLHVESVRPVNGDS